MGLSSSQGRLLMLTSRLSDLQLQEVMVGQRQMELAWQSEEAAKVYNAAMSNFKLTIKLPDATEDSTFRREDLTYTNMTSMGYLVSNPEGAIYLEKEEYELTGEEMVSILQAQIAETEDEDEKTALQAKLAEVTQKNAEAAANGTTYTETAYRWKVPTDGDGKPLLTYSGDTATINGKEYPIEDGSSFLNNKNILQNLIMNGMVFVNNTHTDDVGMTMDLLQSDKYIEYVLDTSDDAEAESKYQYEMASIKRKENQLDLELDQLETQHNAVIKEIDSVKEVIKNNVDRTFKLFSNG